MFSKVLNNTDHVLHHLLTPVHNTSHSYSLRPRAHDRELPDRLTHLTDCNFIIRMLFYQVYWHYFTLHIYIFVLVIVFTAFWQWINKRICYVICYSKLRSAAAGISEQYSVERCGFSGRWWRLEHNVVYRRVNRSMVVSWPWCTAGRRSGLHCQWTPSAKRSVLRNVSVLRLLTDSLP